MSEALRAQSEPTTPAAGAPPLPELAPAPRGESNSRLLKLMLLLAWPVLAEHVLHMIVGMTDTYLANNLVPNADRLVGQQKIDAHARNAAATSAVGSVSYIFWLIGLISGAIAAGSTAIIARATGARHRRLANSVCGQSIAAAALIGTALAVLLNIFAAPVAASTGLTGQGREFALTYLRMLSFAMPFVTVMFVANACLRGAGDTLSPAITFVVVDLVNVFFSYSLAYGKFGFPNWGFRGIATGTIIAYVSGGVIQFIVLLRGRGGLRLYLHRLAPHWHNLKRILRIGVPSGVSDLLQWIVNYAMLVVINRMDKTLVSSAAHNNTIKIEGISFLAGFAFATATATMVGQSLGMKDPDRATRSAYLGFGMGGGLMTLMGVIFIFFGRAMAGVLSNDPAVIDLTARCLFVTGFCQTGFGAAMIFGGGLRGAGDTLKVMMINLTSIFLVRFAGVMLVALVFKQGLAAVWTVLSIELMIRGVLIYGRFVNGGWKKVEV